MTLARHEGCAHAPLGPRPTHVYLRDGTKVVIRREGKAVWLEVVPQAILSAGPLRPKT